jgi:hypothetical protein
LLPPLCLPLLPPLWPLPPRKLKGSANNGKVPFELRVSKAGVTGSFNHTPVEFDLHEVEHIDAKGQ